MFVGDLVLSPRHPPDVPRVRPRDVFDRKDNAMFNLLSREEISEMSSGASYYLFGDDEALAIDTPEYDDFLI